MTELQKITLRVETLERQNRCFRIGAVGLVLLAALGSIAAVNSKPRTIEAEQFIIRDSKGRARVTIGTVPVSGAAVSRIRRANLPWM
jgi:hypothetical protein